MEVVVALYGQYMHIRRLFEKGWLPFASSRSKYFLVEYLVAISFLSFLGFAFFLPTVSIQNPTLSLMFHVPNQPSYHPPSTFPLPIHLLRDE